MPSKYPYSPSASRQTGGKAKEGMPGVRGSGEMKELKGVGRAKPGNGKAKAKTPDFKVGGSYRSGRTIQGATGTKKRVDRAGAAREGMGSKSGGRATVAGGFGKTMPRKSAAGAGRGGADKVAPMRPGTGTGTGYKPNSPAGRGKGGEAMGRNKSSSAQAGKFAPKKKAPMKSSKY
jgi:hypothetical protein